MEEGETGVKIQDQGLAQATAASESRDATETGCRIGGTVGDMQRLVTCLGWRWLILTP